MNFRYKISQDQYLEMLLSLLRSKEHSPFRIFCFLVMTIGQTAWVVYMLLTAELDRRGRIFLIVWSVLLTLINTVFRITRPRRARTALNNLIATEQISPDYWKEHSLTVSGTSAKLRFGKTSFECPCIEITPSEKGGLVYLYSHGKVFDLIPGDCPQKDAIVSALISARSDSKLSILANEDECEEVFRFRQTGEQFRKSQIRVFQTYFFNVTLKSPRYVIKMLLSALLVWFAFYSGFGIRSVLAVCLIIFWNFPAIMCISPVAERYLSARISAFGFLNQEELYDVLICRKGKTLVYTIGTMSWSCSLDSPDFIYSAKEGVMIFGGIWPAALIPSDQFPNRFRQDEYMRTLRYSL